VADAHPPRRYERSGTGLEFDRAAFFSDAVYAIAMTLLVIGIGFPHVRDSELGSKLASLDSEIISFFLGFVILGFYWISHHSLMAQLRAVDTTFLAINLLYLAVVAFLPFPTSVVGSNGSVPLAIVLFACSLAAISIFEVALYVCAHRHDLLTRRPSDAQYRHDIAAGLIPGIVFLASMPLAFVTTNLALVSWILILPAEQVLDRTMVVTPDA
jgi:TMEM175 potassium channel family protein